MNCKHVQSDLSAYLDGELTGSDMLEVRNHLQDCAECSEELTIIQKIKEFVAQPQDCVPAPDFEERLVAHVFGAERKAEPRWKTHVGLAGIAAAAAALAVFAATSLDRNNSTTADPSMYATESMDRVNSYFIATDPFSGPVPAIPANYAQR